MDRKKIFATVLFCTFLLSLILTATSAASKPLVLRWSHPSVERGYEGEWMKWVVDQVEARTNGRVKIQVYWGGTLTKFKEMAEGAKTGLIDVGWVTPSYHPGFGELTGVAHASTIFNPEPSPVEFTKKWYQMLDAIPDFYEDFEKQNIVPIACRYYDVYWIFSNKPVRTLDDLKGMKIRPVSESHQVAARAAGASPVFLGAGEMYSALQKNILDAVAYSPDTSVRYNIHEVTKYLTLTDMTPGFAYWSMNLNTFKKLSWIDQKVVLQVGREASMKMAELMEKERSLALETFRKAGMEIIEFPQAEKLKWSNLPDVKAYEDKWVSDKTANGLAARKAITLFQEIFEIKK